MQRHLSTGSTLISALLAHDRPGGAHPAHGRIAGHADPAAPDFPGPPPPRGKAAHSRMGSRSGHRLGALIQIIAQGHVDMME